MIVRDLFEDQAAQSHVIQWMTPKACRAALEEGSEIVVWVDVAKVDASFKLDRNFYVGPKGSANAIAGRYERFGEWLKAGEPVAMSEIGLGYRDIITFTNGRHRFAWMRDHGAKAVPVVTEASRAKEFVAMFGSNLRRTIIR